jgi:hypothetical protein
MIVDFLKNPYKILGGTRAVMVCDSCSGKSFVEKGRAIGLAIGNQSARNGTLKCMDSRAKMQD